MLLAEPAPNRLAAPSALVPPPGFLPALSPHHIEPWTNPHGRSRATPAQRAGLAYEKKAKRHLSERFPGAVCGQWFRFQEGRSAPRCCQPDVLLFDRPTAHDDDCVITIVEIKIRFTETAWWQLTQLYRPIVEKYYRPKRIHLICMTRSFDPFVLTPEPTPFIDDLMSRSDGALTPGQVGIHIWRP